MSSFLLKSHTPTLLASGLYKGQGTRTVTPLLQKNAETNAIHHIQYNNDRKCWTRPQKQCAMYTGRGKPWAKGHVPLKSQVWLDPPKRPK